MAVFGYEKLRIWREAMQIVATVYRLTQTFPKEESFGLTSQMRRAAVSIPTNIAEGYGRGSDKAFGAFIRIAIGSLYELRTLVSVATNLGYLSEADSELLDVDLVATSKGLAAFEKKLAAGSQLQAASNPE